MLHFSRSVSGRTYRLAALLPMAAFSVLAQAPLAQLSFKAMDGSTTIAGNSPYSAASCAVKVNGTVALAATSDASKCKVNGDGSFTITLPSALKINQLVEVTLAPSGGASPASGTATVGDAISVDMVTPKEGDKSISGSIKNRDSGQTIDHIAVEVVSGSDLLGPPVAATYSDKTDTFSATLTNALTEDESVHVHLYTDANAEIPANGGAQVVQSLGYDWGRVKAYFSLGATYQRSNGKFGSPDGYAGLNVDYNWFRSDRKEALAPSFTKDEKSQGTYVIGALSAIYSRQEPGAKPSGSGATKPAAKTTTYNCDGIALDGTADVSDNVCAPHSLWMINTYFDARLTQIPITQQNSGGSSGSSTSTSSNSIDISQSQGAYFEGGIYAPVIPGWTQWTYHGQKDALFVAPMAKLGFQAISNTSSSTMTAGSSTNTNTNTNNCTSENVSGFSNPLCNSVNRFYGFGARVGLFKMPANPKSEGPELVNYLDITAGKWDNLTYAGAPRTRLDIAGRFKIPFTPLYVGGEVNVGNGPDDLRVFIGTRVDIGPLLAKLIPSTN